METRNYMLLYRLTTKTVFRQEYYITEELARKTANRLFQEGFVYIELFHKCRAGYRSIKKVVQHEGVAKAKHDAYVKAAEQAAQATLLGYRI